MSLRLKICKMIVQLKQIVSFEKAGVEVSRETMPLALEPAYIAALEPDGKNSNVVLGNGLEYLIAMEFHQALALLFNRQKLN